MSNTSIPRFYVRKPTQEYDAVEPSLGEKNLDIALARRLSQQEEIFSSLSQRPASYSSEYKRTSTDSIDPYSISSASSGSSPLFNDEESTLSVFDLDEEYQELSLTIPAKTSQDCFIEPDSATIITSTVSSGVSSPLCGGPDLWEALKADFSQMQDSSPELVRELVYSGIPNNHRGDIWQLLSNSKETHLESVYYKLLLEPTEYDKAIVLDLSRTFPTVEEFMAVGGLGQTKMFKVLKAYAVYDTEIGYCQGLGFIVGTLVRQMSEPQAFCVFMQLIETHSIRSMFLPDLQGLELRIFQLRSLLHTHFPSLFKHLQEHQVQLGMFLPQWFLSFYAACFTPAFVQRLFDIILLEGALETLFRVALAIFCKVEQPIQEMDDFDDIATLLNRGLGNLFESEDELVAQIWKWRDKVDEDILTDLETKYLRIREIFGDSWSEDSF
ncbi:RabGAP/TBC [Basidiobolus meristosporus CBS 931.73]|uniref:RabGAP/TBC n=1 Tax=Basidiobolus meristosporus CBS 931.73 TaxID=1314790 RepID=A0A1Y1Z107_9FUNG|nr:RabGAP/TBC [Basidiobolus meristosporus CBS 931.73]|eukprot:ORY03968.1 RabGAP/TBC [Basidiobolus meristosporus CBS 931.73]